MKRDMELIRTILLKCEEHPYGFAPDLWKIEGYEEHVVSFHCWLIIEAGLADGVNLAGCGSTGSEGSISRLTWQGYEFLEATRDPTNWEKTKAAGKQAGSMGLSVLMQVAVGLASESAMKAAGLR